MPAVRNDETLERLVELLEKNGGDIARACYDIGVSTGWLKKWQRDDAKVEAAIIDAQDTGVLVIESAALKRAIEGVDEPIYYKDQIVGTKKRYSDPLTIKLLESRKREVYGKTVEINQNVNVKQLSDDELDKRIAALSERLGLAPPILADFSEVSEGEFEELVSLDELL